MQAMVKNTMLVSPWDAHHAHNHFGYKSLVFMYEVASNQIWHKCAGNGEVGQAQSAEDAQHLNLEASTANNVEVGSGHPDASRPDSASGKTKVRIKFGGMHV